MLAYSRDWMPDSTIKPNPPAFVALASSVEEVQAIVKLSNRLKFPFIPVGTNYWSINTVAAEPYTVILDPKRMNRILEIDEKKMYAVIEPYVSHAQLLSEANKRGLYIGAPEAGAQASSLANHVFQAAWGVSHRLGMGYRNILSMEWVLPTGDILNTGSLSQRNAGPNWGEGPGPDLRGLIRGSYGVMGGFGVVTKMTVKLHPYPGPKVFPCEGLLPNQTSVMPKDRFEWVLFTYPTAQKAVDAMYEICQAELAGNCSKWPTSYLNWWWAKSGEEYWETWKSKFWQKNCDNMVSVCLWGFTSAKQVEYEKRVLDDIIKETGGEMVPKKVYDRIVPKIANAWIRTAYGPRVISRSGTFMVFSIHVDTMDSNVKTLDHSKQFLDKFSPPILDSDHTDWIASYEMGHLGYEEDMFPIQKTKEELGSLMESFSGELEKDLKRGHEYNIAPALGAVYHKMAGPVFGYDKLLKGIKQSLDPNDVSCPPQPIPND
ncbi:MAG: FAD-binding oxidoreductase [Deltaproteobacteria bacterium]|nr:FAD-binding oxidoreductase [Deltaproteobacteria bacterium]